MCGVDGLPALRLTNPVHGWPAEYWVTGLSRDVVAELIASVGMLSHNQHQARLRLGRDGARLGRGEVQARLRRPATGHPGESAPGHHSSGAGLLVRRGPLHHHACHRRSTPLLAQRGCTVARTSSRAPSPRSSSTGVPTDRSGSPTARSATPGRRRPGPGQVRLRQDQAERREVQSSRAPTAYVSLQPCQARHLREHHTGHRGMGAQTGRRAVTSPRKFTPAWCEERHGLQRKAHSSRRIRVERGIVQLKTGGSGPSPWPLRAHEPRRPSRSRPAFHTNRPSPSPAVSDVKGSLRRDS